MGQQTDKLCIPLASTFGRAYRKRNRYQPTYKWTIKQTDMDTLGDGKRHTFPLLDKQTDRQTVSLADIKTDKQADGQSDGCMVDVWMDG